jgi:hypothetical protein
MTATARSAHQAAIATLTAATTTAELAAAIDGFTALDKPGFPNQLPDGRYYDGAFFATMTGGVLQTTLVHHLPAATMTLWEQLSEEQRVAREREQLLTDEADDRRGPGQPPIGRPVPIRLPAWLIADLDHLAKQEGTSRARLIRGLIGEALAARRAS